MKLNGKALTLLLSASIIFSLSGCGGGSSTTTETVINTDPAPGELGYQVINPDGSITYVDYTEGNRTAPASAAAAEYHTGIGFGNTLFDSADKKCQNCHNELYDTWKSSMHGKSWTDPIFQSKYEDFLRGELAKIGSTGQAAPEDPADSTAILYEQVSVGVGTKNMFNSVAQTCIKCHAPGAYYAGDVQISVTELQDISGEINATAFATLKTANEVLNNPHGEIAVIAASKSTKKIYKATLQIGHEANREGINCAFCHSIETPRLMKADGMDNGIYTLAQDMRNGPHGSIVFPKGSDLEYDVNATNPHMNAFFKLVGPEKYAAYHTTPKEDFDINKTADGRFTMTSKDINGTAGKVHFTGGPFYGPYGVTGISNENTTDQTDRSAQVNPHFDRDGNNHFGESGKGLCLSCHQRSAGGLVPNGAEGAGSFMELCSTQMAVSNGEATTHEDTITSPKCQKCHMERIEGTVLHKWARPDLKWTLADNDHLTAEFNPDDETVPAGENPVRDGWLNSHAFLGASKTGHDAASATAKIQSGFDATLDAVPNGDTLTVTTTLTNKTAHMFPGAHPMRRVLTRVIVTSDQGPIDVISSTGASVFADIENNVQPLQGKVLDDSAFSPVLVQENGNRAMDFPGKVVDFDENGESAVSQEFNTTSVRIEGVDSTLLNQTVSGAGATTGDTKYATIVESAVKSNFTRIYGRETGKKYNNNTEYVVRPGFDSNIVRMDNRLSPNETETYTLTYDIKDKTGVKVEYRVYYMQKGANGAFPTTEDGWLNDAVNAEKKLLITEVFKEVK